MDMRLQGNRPGDDVARRLERSRERGRTGSVPGSAERERGGLDGRSGAGRQPDGFRNAFKGLGVDKKGFRREVNLSAPPEDELVALVGVDLELPRLQKKQTVPAVAEVERDA